MPIIPLVTPRKLEFIDHYCHFPPTNPWKPIRCHLPLIFPPSRELFLSQCLQFHWKYVNLFHLLNNSKWKILIRLLFCNKVTILFLLLQWNVLTLNQRLKLNQKASLIFQENLSLTQSHSIMISYISLFSKDLTSF